jgi:hypothetical protein
VEGATEQTLREMIAERDKVIADLKREAKAMSEGNGGNGVSGDHKAWTPPQLGLVVEARGTDEVHEQEAVVAKIEGEMLIDPLDVIEDWALAYHLGMVVVALERSARTRLVELELASLREASRYLERYVAKLEARVLGGEP